MWSDKENRQLDKYGVCFDWLSEVSDAALEREKEAKSLFHHAKNELERNTPLLASLGKKKHVIEDAVPPKHHLTAHTWKTFRSWVENHHPGWKAKRRVASEWEIKEYEAEDKNNRCPSRGKSYFISFTYQHPSTLKRKKTDKKGDVDTKGGRGGDDDEVKKPPAKKRKSKAAGGASFEDLPEVIQTHILSFCDVPSLGAVVLVSKTFNRLAKQDRLWEPHLKELLHELFDGAIQMKSWVQQGQNYWNGRYEYADDPTTPLTERDDWRQSTALLRWLREPRAGGGVLMHFAKKTACFHVDFELDEYSRQRERNATARRSSRLAAAASTKPVPQNPYEHYDFLFQDVSFYEYYHRAGHMAYLAASLVDKGGVHFCRDCVSTWERPPEFRFLPKICFCF